MGRKFRHLLGVSFVSTSLQEVAVVSAFVPNSEFMASFADGCATLSCERCEVKSDCVWMSCECEYLARLQSVGHRLVFVCPKLSKQLNGWGT